MAKNFPYFKFIVSEWMTGDIVFESLSTQGLFINICALYWQRDGNLSIEDINKRYKNPIELKELTDRFIHVKDNFISINFLDEQLIDAGHISKINSDKGKKSAIKRAAVKQQLNNGSTDVQPISTNKNKNKNESKEEKEENNKEYIDIDFLETFENWMRYKSERKETYKSETSKQTFYKKLLELSNNNPIIAKQIVEQSIANNWAGIFELKQQSQSNGNKAANGMVY